jgi:2-oxoisovalerate dehydrogenase E1 component
MVIRIAGLAYQKGFGGHFHNDNSIAVFRDIPGVILACPSSAGNAQHLLKECIRLAREERRVVVFLEPIALYGIKDLHEDGDGLMLSDAAADAASIRHDSVRRYEGAGKHGTIPDLTIITYGNGTYFARRCQKRLADQGTAVQVIDLCWLAPLPMDDLLAGLDRKAPILIVDECRRSGSLSEEIMARLVDEDVSVPIKRVTGEDSFIPLGPAANEVLLSEEDIMAAALWLTGHGEGAR